VPAMTARAVSGGRCREDSDEHEEHGNRSERGAGFISRACRLVALRGLLKVPIHTLTSAISRHIVRPEFVADRKSFKSRGASCAGATIPTGYCH
jgi:hypothetical protein